LSVGLIVNDVDRCRVQWAMRRRLTETVPAHTVVVLGWAGYSYTTPPGRTVG